MNKINCAIYTRVSTRNQSNAEYSSLEAQKDRLLSFIKSKENFELYEIYEDEAYSGSNMDRPAFNEMISDVKKGELIAC